MAELPHSLDASTMSGKGFGLDDHDLDDMFDDDEDELRGGGSDDAVAEAPSSRGARGARDDAEVGMSARHHSISLESPRSVPQESGPDAAIDEKGHLAEQHRMLSLQSQHDLEASGGSQNRCFLNVFSSWALRRYQEPFFYDF